jgi:hypothetical protein
MSSPVSPELAGVISDNTEACGGCVRPLSAFNSIANRRKHKLGCVEETQNKLGEASVD